MFSITGLTIYKGCRHTKNLKARTYSFGKNIYQDFYGLNIDIHAIVGMNGSGKSSLLDMTFRLINNFGALLYRDEPRNAADELNYVRGIHADLCYEKTDQKTRSIVKGVLCCRGNSMWLEYGDILYWLSDERIQEKYPEQDAILMQEKMEEWSSRNFITYRSDDKGLQAEIANHFFYTVATNYSMLGFVDMDYADEESLVYRLPDGTKDIKKNQHLKQWYFTRNWIGSLFHKNDGYMCPIVLNPYRDEGQLDMSNETGLTISRLTSLLIREDGKSAILENYCLDEIKYTLNKDFYLTFKKGQEKKLDLGEMWEEVRSLYKQENTYVYHILKNLGIEIGDKPSNITLFSCLYLVYKVLHIAGTYPSYHYYKKLGNVNNTFKKIPKAHVKLVENLVKQVMSHHSHIEQKVQQTLQFLKTIYAVKEKRKNVNFDWMELPFEYEGYRDFMEYEQQYERLEDLSLRLPPPIFNQQIFLKKQVQENGEKVWKKEIPFSHLSSGEKQLIYQLTTIVYHILNIKSVSTDNIRYHDINIVLDEIEVCFHPDYQRKFIHRLLALLTGLGLNKNFGIHIWLTTHSPFVLSDIPASQILYLENGDVLTGQRLRDIPNPFASNVSEILHQSFFLSQGFIGEFARDRILSLTRYLKGSKEDKQFWENVDIEGFIDGISEPFIKNQLELLNAQRTR